MSYSDFHVHTTYSDGNNTPEEMVQAAIAQGMTTLGFSDHSYTSFDLECCIPLDRISAYKAEIAALKEKYADQIEIRCGIEQDYDSAASTKGYDYVIGSVHYLYVNGKFFAVDIHPDELFEAVNIGFGGDVYALCEAYYRKVADVVRKTNADIIGHFDLISKFNEHGELFDPEHPRYVAAYQAAVDALLKTGKPFEINTGAMSRGYRVTPYPSMPIYKYIKQNGGTFVLSSDSHAAETLCFQFDEWKHLL